MTAGHIERLKSGAFRVKVYAGKDPITGKKLYLNETHPSEDKAKAARDRLVAQVEAKANPDRAATLASLLDQWMETAEHELSTREADAGYIRRTINPALGDWPLRKLQHRVDLLDRLYSHLRRCSKLCDGKGRDRDGQPTIDHRTNRPHDCHAPGKRECRPHVCDPMAPATIRRINAILSAALNYALRWGWIERNPASLAQIRDKKAQRTRRAKPPEADLVARLLNLAFERDPDFGIFLWLAATTGARRGELVAIRWNHVDLTTGEINLQDNYIVRSGIKQTKATKTDEDHPICLDSLTLALLAELKQTREQLLAEAGLELDPAAYVFTPDPAGLAPWNPDTFTHRYERLAAEVGITTPLKNLRHFNATRLLAGGVDLATVAGRLGHSDGGVTTLRFYADRDRPADAHAAELLAQDLHALREAAARNGNEGHDGNAARHGSEGPTPAGASTPTTPRAPYLVIAAALRERIASGALAVGEALPTVKALADEHGVSYGTAQRAIAVLAEEGAVAVSRGKRATVVAHA